MIDSISNLELVSVACNIIFILLLAFEKKICWLFGIAGSVTGAVLFFNVNYYSEAILYVFYAIMGVFGWIMWSKPEIGIQIRKAPKKMLVILLLLGAMGSAILGWFMSKTDADMPFYDAFSTVFGIIATFMEIYKFLIAWVFWFVLNAYSIWLYAIKDVKLYALLMAVYTVLSVVGYLQWSRKMAKF